MYINIFVLLLQPLLYQTFKCVCSLCHNNYIKGNEFTTFLLCVYIAHTCTCTCLSTFLPYGDNLCVVVARNMQFDVMVYYKFI